MGWTIVDTQARQTQAGRPRRMWPRAAKAAAFCACVLAAAASAGEEPFQPRAVVTPAEIAPGQSATITVTISIAPRHYLYVGETSLQAAEAPGLSFGKAVIPKGTPKLDPFLGATEVYKKEAKLTLPVAASADAKPGERTLKLSLRYQGCTDRACFLPKQVAVEAKLSISGSTDRAAARDAAFAALDAQLDAAQAAAPAAKQAAKRFSVSAIVEPAKVAPGQKAIVKVTFTMAARHHLYAKETGVIPKAMPEVTFGQVAVPPWETKTDPYLGAQQVYKKRAVFEAPLVVDPAAKPGTKTITLTAKYMGCGPTTCFPPETVELTVPLEVAGAPVAGAAALPAVQPPADAPGSSQAEVDRLRDIQNRFGFIGVLLVAFVAGLGLSLTPCVYPMIPVTVGVIGASGAKSKMHAFVLSLLFVLGMSVTYAVLGAAAASSGALFGSYGNHPAVRATVAGVFALLALSMFDVFYIQMPSSIQSKLAGRKGAGMVGVFITGLAAGAMVGPCVGPFLLGILLYIAQIGDKVAGFLIMWSVALGMGVLLLAVGTFSGAAAALPKPGRWMDAVKHFFGILLLGLALYYLKTVLPAKAFVLGVDVYLIGVGIFVASLLPAPTSELPKTSRRLRILGIALLVAAAAYVTRLGLGTPVLHEAGGITWFTDEAAAMARAQEQKKPMMIDFRADWCTYCLKLEAETFPDAKVVAEAKRFVALKVDCPAGDDAAKAIQRKYGVQGLPTIVFVDSSGQILTEKTITEFVKPDVLLARMREIE